MKYTSKFSGEEIDSILDSVRDKQDAIPDLETIRNNAKNASDTIARMVESGYLFAGIATIDTNPRIPDAKVFYIANGKGTYINFGGLEVTEDDVVVLYWDTSWHKVATGIASQAKLSELDKRIVIDAILSEAFTVVSLTRDSDGNVISGNIKYSDGIAGTIAITRNADGNATSMVATHGTDSYTLSITRDANGDVIKTSIN